MCFFTCLINLADCMYFIQFQEERLGMALVTLKALDRAISDTIQYTKERKVFGKSILDNQVVHFQLAELATEIEALRAITYRAVGE